MAKPKMLTCIARPKSNGESASQRGGDLDSEKTPNSKQLAIKTLTSQIKGMAVKASGAYKCNPCAHPTPSQAKKAAAEPVVVDGEGSERFRWSGSYRRTTSTNSASRWGKEMEARLKVLSTASSREGSARSPYGSGAASAAASGRRTDSPAAAVVVVEEETEPKEWVAQVEPGVLITFVSLPRGGNDLKRIRFSRDTFDQMQAQRWWTDNYEKVMELYNVQRLNRQGVPFPTDPPKPEERTSKKESTKIGPVTPPLTPEILPRNLHHGEGTDDYLSSDSYNDIQRQKRKQSKQINESSGLASTPKYSNISSATKLETSSMDDQSLMSSSSTDADHLSGQLSFSNASDLESEWVEEDEPGVYITIRALPGGRRELRRVRFSRERFAEMNARLWWEENRARIHEQYL